MISKTDDSNKQWLKRPKIRPLEAVSFEDENGGEQFLLKDPARISPRSLAMSPAAISVIRYFDGRLSVEEIQDAVQNDYNEKIPLDVIGALIGFLDDNYFLEGKTFNDFFKAEVDAFAAADHRNPVLSGGAYPDERDALSNYLNAFVSAGEPDYRATVQGAVIPHIDFERGGRSYGVVYEKMDPQKKPDLAVILGTAHCPMTRYFTASAKDFDTPFGTVRCDREFIREYHEKSSPPPAIDEYVHKNEHSIEFQTIWLANRFGVGELKVAPVLCGSLQLLIEAGALPEDVDDYAGELSCLKEVIDKRRRAGQRVMVIASADLSHVGLDFDDDFKVTPAVQARIHAMDLAVFELAASGDYRSFYNVVAERRNETNICGVAPIYALLNLLDGIEGNILSYDQWCDGETGRAMVSFGSILFD